MSHRIPISIGIMVALRRDGKDGTWMRVIDIDHAEYKVHCEWNHGEESAWFPADQLRSVEEYK